MSAMLLCSLLLFSCINCISTTTYTCDPSTSCGCSALSTVVTSRVVGGEAAPDHAWGWVVSLQRSLSHTCGGSLLTSEYAITAAHCVVDVLDDISILSILAGTNYLNDVSDTTMQRRSIITVTIHPNYDAETVTNDVAILYFSPLNVSSDSEIAFICLPQSFQDPFQINTSLVAIGWGYTSEGSGVVSNSLQQVTVQVFPSTFEGCILSGLANSSLQFCAGTAAGGKDTCQGDSGGPIMAFVNNTWVLAGTTSTGYGCARAGYPGVYARTSAFISFINSNINLSITETETVISSTSESNYNQSNFQRNQGNVIDKSVMMLMFWLSFSILFSFSY